MHEEHFFGKKNELFNARKMKVGLYIYSSSKLALPYLKKSSNPHILMNSPPISLNPFWFKGHVAYTVAKYNMSLYALGLSAELREFGIAVNAIWPKTGNNSRPISLSNSFFI